MQNDKDAKWFERNGLTPPSSTPHGVSADDLSDRLTPLKAESWRLEGNRLIAKTRMGEVVNLINPNYIMTGVDENNLPILKKL